MATRRIVFAPSFDAELLAISVYIQGKFGGRAAEKIEARIRNTTRTLADSPLIGTTGHGYPTKLYGMVQSPNWLFYRFTDAEVQFLHIRDGRMEKGPQSFEG